MRQHVHLGRRLAAGLTSLVMAAGVLAVAAQPAAADTAPADPTVPETVAADGLPTVQIDGVVWDQEIVGNRVYVAGNFTTARPAGAAPGTSTVPRSHLLAYDLTTGVLITSFAPTLNAQARSLSVSPDGTRLYVGGEFTSVNGSTRYRVAAFDAATGALQSWAPVVNARVAVVEATNTSVYIGGIFSQAGGANRVRVAQLDATSGLALPFTATPADGQVAAIAISPDRSTVVVGGSFTAVDGAASPGYGLARLDASTGASLPLAVNGLIRNGGENASIYSLYGDDRGFYGTGYVYGSGGNLEGAFSADWEGNLRWVEDCHGDSYDVYTSGDVTYTVGHPHYCATVDGYPQTEPWTAYYANAFTNFVTGPVGRNLYSSYFQFEGNPGPSLLTFFPAFTPANFTGASQATWTVTGNGDYVVYGGEFTHVNGTRQQGLVRMAKKSIAPNKQGPRLYSTSFPVSAQSHEAGEVRIAWNANFDRDNETLTYRVHRGGTVVNEQVVTAKFWNLPQLGFVDTTAAPGSTQQYRVSARDAFNNVQYSDWVTVTVAADGTLSPYAQKVLDDGARSFWRLGEGSGATVRDWAGFNPATALDGVTRGTAGVVAGDPDTASTFDGTDAGRVASQRAQMGRDAFTVEAWFRTTTRAGGKIVGFGNLATGNSARHDRNLYMNTSGQVLFGAFPGTTRTLQSPTALNDGEWHHVSGTLGADGMSLYVDGKRVASRADTVSALAFDGYWRIGGDTTWSGGRNFTGSIDDVAVYDRPLTAAEIDSHYVLSGRASALPPVPADPYGQAVHSDAPDLYWRLGEASGPTAADSGVRNITGAYRNGVVLGQPSGIVGTTNTSARFDGVNDTIGSNVQFVSPSAFTQELWFSTTSTTGGKLVGFGSAASGLSSSYDRHVFLDATGRLTFGAYPGTQVEITSPAAYNDGAWHHLVASQSAAGMRLYVDGVLVGSNAEARAQTYNGYWRVGGDSSWNGTPAYLAARIDEVAVYGRALTDDEVREHFTLGSGTAPANALPVAAFTATPGQRTVAVDASASSDSDGTVTAYAWSFGDGGTATGATATHPYAVGGPYTVTLTVTDDKGGSASTSQQVTVTDPPPNVPPIAAFTSTTSDLTVAVDGSTSSDPDGTVTAYAWTFGDGGTATGATATHDYDAAGTYPVTLTVTDNTGATHQRTAQVTVTDPPVVTDLARDVFDRTVANGWGAAATGGTWTPTTAAAGFSVAAGTGTHRMGAAGANVVTYLDGVSSTDTEVTVAVVPDQEPTGGGTYVSVLGRRVDATNDYRTRLRLWPGGKVTLQLQRGATTLTAADVAGLTSVAGQPLRVRLQVTGTTPTTIRAKVWRDGTAEPAAWQLTTTDATAALQVPGSIGLHSYLSGSSTTLPATVGFRDLWAGPAQ
ncbi:LamG-like jellyroll fold domain-containing protein [Cellulomonas sp. NS3]|uniref:LamG-like jellyroll fold domain-containing protein n=1 Tax=Cellulomonas sp. NS3 TaxID=2973977 RepID=UPI002161DB1B|nr:LamG-like jellyroll fold domain-containing protein [Cellulomonas sp. NS3]